MLIYIAVMNVREWCLCETERASNNKSHQIILGAWWRRQDSWARKFQFQHKHWGSKEQPVKLTYCLIIFTHISIISSLPGWTNNRKRNRNLSIYKISITELFWYSQISFSVCLRIYITVMYLATLANTKWKNGASWWLSQ